MHKLTSFFVYAVLADGLLSMAESFRSTSAGSDASASFAELITLVALMLAGVLFVGMIITPRLPKRILVAPVLFMGLAVVLMQLFGNKITFALSACEAVLAGGIIIGFGEWAESQWVLQDYASERPLFTWKNFAITGCLSGVFAAVLVLLSSLGLLRDLRTVFEETTGGYATVRTSGLALEERRFQRGDKEVRLIGMIHIARSGFYDDVLNALPANATAVVLLEGISDHEQRFKEKLGYGHLAQMLGIHSQGDSSFTKAAKAGLAEERAEKASGEKSASSSNRIKYLSADVDSGAFKSTTVRYIQAITSLFDSRSAEEAVNAYTAAKPTLVEDSREAFADILDKRNEHIIGEIDKAVAQYSTVVVPWGAYHMPFLQRKLVERGFVETKRVQHQAIGFENRALVLLVQLIDALPAKVP